MSIKMKKRDAAIAGLVLIAALTLASCLQEVEGARAAAAPAEVGGLNAAPGNREVVLTWTDPADRGFVKVRVFITFIDIDTNTTIKKYYADVFAGVQTATVTPLDNDTAYTFTVCTVDTSGNESAGTSVTATPSLTVATPTARPGAGVYTGPQSVYLDTTTAGAVIYYTLNGSSPTQASTRYTAAIRVSMGTTLKAIAVMPGWFDSAVLTAAYTPAPPLTGTVSIIGTAETNETLSADTSLLGGSGAITYQWKRGSVNVGTNTSLYPLTTADVGAVITVVVSRAGNSGTITGGPTAAVTARPAPTYRLADPTNPDIAAKFGVSTPNAAFAALHDLISNPHPGDDFATIIRLGDYIDLPSLTIGATTITDAAITGGAGRGKLLRLLVVGINSFKRNSSGAGSVTANNPGAPGHVVFQFQNIPVTHRVNSWGFTAGGYAVSEMRTWLRDNFLPGLQTAAGITPSMLWAPQRRVANGGWNSVTAADPITDMLWLPTEWEMTGGILNAQQLEVNAGQARLEYYTTNARRIKYTAGNAARRYYLASPFNSDNFCDIWEDGTRSSRNAGNSEGAAPAFCVK